VFVRDFYAQAKQMFADCDEATIFARLSDAVACLSNKGITDSLVGEMEICACSGCLTLPRDVGTVLGINVHGRPTLLQDQWFSYHINGPGSGACAPCSPNSYELGQVCTFRDPSEPCYLIAEVTNAADNNKKLRVYATRADDGRKIFTPGPDGVMQEGFLVPLIFGYAQRNPDVPALGTIYRISKEDTKDFVKLIAINASDGVSQTLIGIYEPKEALPQYRRIRVGNKTSVRIKYKRANIPITSLGDFIALDNPEALRLACRAVKLRKEDKLDAARPFEEEASRILAEETEAKRPSGPRVPQVISGVFQDNEDNLYYSSHGGGGPGGGGNW
jgi:hypothetical protein